VRTASCQSSHENEGQKARAEQDEAGSGQGQETVGDRIMMAHGILLFRRSPEFIKTFETSCLKQMMEKGA
jgi:hypothetical protein